ncbi:MAG: hypothetical protein MRZ79_00285 [Bacteroidia bacterium]|nr:hypothetical protein [Bacteroidia bacterium]
MQDPIVPTPSGFKVIRQNGSLVMIRRWWKIHYLLLTFFTIAWDSFIIFIYRQAFKGGNPDWGMALGAIFHLMVAVFLTYYTLAGFINKTIIVIGQASLSITHDPLWWPGSRSYSSQNFHKVFVKTEENRRWDSEREEYEFYTSHSLRMRDKEGKERILIEGFDDLQDAIFLEDMIRKELKLSE